MRVACFDQKSFSNEGHQPLGSQVFREKHQQFQVFGFGLLLVYQVALTVTLLPVLSFNK